MYITIDRLPPRRKPRKSKEEIARLRRERAMWKRCEPFTEALEAMAPTFREGRHQKDVLKLVYEHGITSDDFWQMDERPGQFGRGEWHAVLRSVRNHPVFGLALFDQLGENAKPKAKRRLLPVSDEHGSQMRWDTHLPAVEYGLRTPPEGKWSGSGPLPAIGDMVYARINRIGHARVVAYGREHAWVGIEILPTKPPAWYTKQNGPGATCFVFGAELGTQP